MYDKPKYQNLPYNLKCTHLQKYLQIIKIFLQFFLQAYANKRWITYKKVKFLLENQKKTFLKKKKLNNKNEYKKWKQENGKA
jgi:hypothetical protein